MIEDEDIVQLSESCFNMCVALESAIPGKNVGDLNGSVRTILEVLEGCVD